MNLLARHSAMDVDEDAKDLLPMPSPIAAQDALDADEGRHIVLGAEVGNSMGLGKKRVSSQNLGREQGRGGERTGGVGLKQAGTKSARRADP